MHFLLLLSLLFPLVKHSRGIDCNIVVCPGGTTCINDACVCVGDSCPGAVTTTIATTTTASNVRACASNPCRNGCECVESCKHANGYFCRSDDGFIGKNCDIVAPLLTCGAGNITISTDARLLQDVYPSRSSDFPCLYISTSAASLDYAERCRVCNPNYAGFYDISVLLPFDKCGIVEQTTSSGEAVFTGKLWANFLGQGYDAPVPVLNFQCSYDKEYSIVASLRPVIESKRGSIENRMRPLGYINLCKVHDACPKACPPLYAVDGGAVYTVAETIHASMSLHANLDWYTSDSVTTSGRYVTIVQEMHLSCQQAYNDRKVELVANGCGTSKLSTFIKHDGESNVVCVSFLVPRMRTCPNSIFYIHATLRIVEKTSTLDCNAAFAGKHAPERARRSSKELQTFNKNDTEVVSVAIVVLDGSEGRPSSSLFDAELNVDNPKTSPTNSQSLVEESNLTIAVAVIAGIAVVLLLVTVALCFKHQSK